MTLSKKFAAALILAGSGVAGTAAAAPVEQPWFVHVGPGRMAIDEGSGGSNADVTVAGMPVPGAAVSADSSVTGAIEIGRFVTPAIAIGLSVGIPIEQTITGARTLAPFGDLGRLTYGPAAVTVQYRPFAGEALRPYVGAGVAYLHVFDTEAGTLTDAHARDGVGPVLQAGVEIPVRGAFGVFVDAKKGFLTTHVTGRLGPAPVDARVRLDPLVLHAGLAVRF